MSAAGERHAIPYSQFETLRAGRDLFRQQVSALTSVGDRLDGTFSAAVERVLTCAGSVVVTGMGKAGLIGRKISATLASTGTPSHFLHPAEAVHGDLGAIREDDVVLALSNSGETEEVCRLLPLLRRMGVGVIAVTAGDGSTLGRAAEITLTLGRLQEADEYGLAPSTSTTAMLVLGDALALVVSRRRGFTPERFALFHPGGSLGRRLTLVSEMMRKPGELRVARAERTIREVFSEEGSPKRRTGAVMIVNKQDVLVGLFTDSDLARLLGRRQDGCLDQPVSEVMTANPLTIRSDATLDEAVTVLSSRKVSELPVVDEHHHPIGLIDITDVIALMPASDCD